MGFVAAAVVVIWAAALSACDVRERRLPNVLTLSGAVVVLGAAAVCGRGGSALLGAVALAGCYLVIHLISPAGMGAGDVKLALALGALTGAFGVPVWILAAVCAPMFTTALGMVTMMRHGNRVVPHGPSMCAASLLAAALAVL